MESCISRYFERRGINLSMSIEKLSLPIKSEEVEIFIGIRSHGYVKFFINSDSCPECISKLPPCFLGEVLDLFGPARKAYDQLFHVTICNNIVIKLCDLQRKPGEQDIDYSVSFKKSTGKNVLMFRIREGEEIKCQYI